VTTDLGPLARRIVDELRARPLHFGQLVEAHADVGWREFLRAWGEVRAANVLERDDAGRYLVGPGAGGG
jgi:hypothetical protein